ncbi:MAG: rRNA maturation RNase YbeY [Nocardioidaceae bacterium]
MSIEVLNESGFDTDAIGLGRLARFTLDRLRVHPQAELCVKLVDADTMATLNEQWMGQHGPTDVLAFPMDELRPGQEHDEPMEGMVGDVVLCPQVAAEQAPANRQSVRDEVDLLTVHGILHLLGYDHTEPEEHREMFALQARLLADWQRVRRGEPVDEARS